MEIATLSRDHIPRGGVVRFRAEASAPPKRSCGFGGLTQSSSIQNHFFNGGFTKPCTIYRPCPLLHYQHRHASVHQDLRCLTPQK
jgi:hypothetical protein